jgi:hypothetical protein
VAEQAEAGDVGHGVTPSSLPKRLPGVEGAHPVAGQATVLVAQLAFLLGGGEDADAQRLGQVQAAANGGGVVALGGACSPRR